jgi:pyruvate dehydrogenase E1 component
MPEVVAAAKLLADEGVAATVIDVTSADRLYRSWQAELRAASTSARPPDLAGRTALGRLLSGSSGTPGLRAGAAEPLDVPIVTVHDAASHALAWVGAAVGALTVPLGFDEFGQSGSVEDLYRHLGFLPDQIATTALVALQACYG